MDSLDLYEKYLSERVNKKLLKFKNAFATYVIEGEECYIEDIYVLPEIRQKGVASALANEITKIAKEAGCTYLTGSIDPTTNGATESMKALLAYGFKLAGLHGKLIVLVKHI